jgi:hypothetical protein
MKPFFCITKIGSNTGDNDFQHIKSKNVPKFVKKNTFKVGFLFAHVLSS